MQHYVLRACHGLATVVGVADPMVTQADIVPTLVELKAQARVMKTAQDSPLTLLFPVNSYQHPPP